MRIGELVHFVSERGTHLPAWVVAAAMGENEPYDLFVAGAPHELAGRVCQHYPCVPRDEEKGVISWHAVEAEEQEGKKGGETPRESLPRERLR